MTITETRHNFDNPKGYALFVGLDNFQDSNDNLKHCIDDVNFWKNHFVLNQNYDAINSLTNEQATVKKFICAIWSLAARALPGDIVTITISTHGLYNDKQNTLLFFDNRINENQFHFLLKAFKPYVRIFVITDACYSGTWVENRNRNILPGELNELKNILKNRFPDSNEKLDLLFQTQDRSPVVALVNHLASANDFTEVSDGIITKINQAIPIHVNLINIEQYRSILSNSLKASYSIETCVSMVISLMVVSRKTRDYVNLVYDSKKFSSLSLFLKHEFEDAKRMFIFKYSIKDFNSDLSEDDKKIFKKSFDYIESYYNYHFLSNPVVNYSGINSTMFKTQKMFAKNNLPFLRFYKSKIESKK